MKNGVVKNGVVKNGVVKNGVVVVETGDQGLPCEQHWKASREAGFSTLDDLEGMFNSLRDQHVRFLGSAARRAVVPPPRCRRLSDRTTRSQPQQSLPSATDTPHRGLHQVRSLMYALLSVVDPSVDLLPPDERDMCTKAFLERASWSIANNLHGVATAYRVAVGSKNVQVEDVVESLRDADAALSDEGANDAALLHLSRLLNAALVLRRNDVGGCVVIPPTATPKDPAVLVAWCDVAGRYQLRSRGREPLSAIRTQLCREAGVVGPPPLSTVSLDELHILAQQVAAHNLMGGGRVTKSRLAQAIADAAALPS